MTVLCRPDLVPRSEDLPSAKPRPSGFAGDSKRKRSLAREFKKVHTEWGEVTIKIARWPNGAVANASPEYEDCRKIAAEHSVPLKQVMQDATQAYLALRKGERS